MEQHCELNNPIRKELMKKMLALELLFVIILSISAHTPAHVDALL